MQMEALALCLAHSDHPTNDCSGHHGPGHRHLYPVLPQLTRVLSLSHCPLPVSEALSSSSGLFHSCQHHHLPPPAQSPRLVSLLLLFNIFLAMTHSMCDLSSPARDHLPRTPGDFQPPGSATPLPEIAGETTPRKKVS